MGFVLVSGYVVNEKVFDLYAIFVSEAGRNLIGLYFLWLEIAIGGRKFKNTVLSYTSFMQFNLSYSK